MNYKSAKLSAIIIVVTKMSYQDEPVIS